MPGRHPRIVARAYIIAVEKGHGQEMVLKMKLREFFPFWEKPRKHIVEAVKAIPEEGLGVPVRAGGRSVGDTLRHILAVEEGLLISALKGERYERMRPANWPVMTPEQKAEFYRQRFGGLMGIANRLEEHTRVGLELLEEWDAEERHTLRKTPWGQEWTVQFIFWHLEEHLVHHRAQVYLGLRARGYAAPEVT
jgi:uncharacterized damage-inducible protein DinB